MKLNYLYFKIRLIIKILKMFPKSVNQNTTINICAVTSDFYWVLGQILIFLIRRGKKNLNSLMLYWKVLSNKVFFIKTAGTINWSIIILIKPVSVLVDIDTF